MSLVHDLLYQPDLLGLIATELALLPEENRSTLSLALTCKAFLEPALDSLWYQAKSSSVLRVLPADLWTVRPMEHDGGENDLFPVYVSVVYGCTHSCHSMPEPRLLPAR